MGLWYKVQLELLFHNGGSPFGLLCFLSFFPLFPKHGLKINNLFPIVSFKRHFKMNDAIYTNVTCTHMTIFDSSRHCHTWQRLWYIYIYIISEAYLNVNNFNKEQHFKSENGRSNVVVDRNRPLEYIELVQVFFLHGYFCNNLSLFKLEI